MSRKNGPEPFYRESRKRWCVEIDGKQYTLGKTEAQARERWHELMSLPKPVASQLVAGVIDGYLDWCGRHRSPRTYDWYKDHLEAFCNSLSKPDAFAVAELKPHHVLAWVDSHSSWGSSHKRGGIGAVQRAFNWAEKVGHIDRNPVRYIEGKPSPARREDYLTAEQFAQVIGRYDAGDPFRLLLEFAWETGARTQEAKAIEARHFAKDRRRIEFPPAEAKGKKRWRIIYLTDRAFEIVETLCKKHPKGQIFRNEDGEPWNAWSTNCRLERLKKHIGFKMSMTTLRHSFCQRMLEQGLDATTVAALLGHTNAVMVSAVYSHMSQAKSFLADQLKKASA